MNQVVIDGNAGAVTYVDPQGAFTLSVPSGWLVDNSGQQGSKVILFQPASNGDFRPNVGVVTQPLAPLTTDEYVMLSRLQAKKLSGKSALEVDQSASMPPGGHLIEWVTIQMGPIALRFRQLLVVHQEAAYTVTATGGSHQFEALRSTLEAALTSFRTLPA